MHRWDGLISLVYLLFILHGHALPIKDTPNNDHDTHSSSSATPQPFVTHSSSSATPHPLITIPILSDLHPQFVPPIIDSQHPRPSDYHDAETQDMTQSSKASSANSESIFSRLTHSLKHLFSQFYFKESEESQRAVLESSTSRRSKSVGIDASDRVMESGDSPLIALSEPPRLALDLNSLSPSAQAHESVVERTDQERWAFSRRQRPHSGTGRRDASLSASPEPPRSPTNPFGINQDQYEQFLKEGVSLPKPFQRPQRPTSASKSFRHHDSPLFSWDSTRTSAGLTETAKSPVSPLSEESQKPTVQQRLDHHRAEFIHTKQQLSCRIHRWLQNVPREPFLLANPHSAPSPPSSEFEFDDSEDYFIRNPCAVP